MWEQLDGLTYMKGRSRFWRNLYCPCAICSEGQIQTQQPCVATANSSCRLQSSWFHCTRPSNISWGAPWNDTHDWSQPNWSSGAGNWASDYWQDSIWSRVCDKREGPASDKQRCLNLPHVTTLGLKHPLPLDERKELLLELIEQGRPKDTASFPRVGLFNWNPDVSTLPS